MGRDTLNRSAKGTWSLSAESRNAGALAVLDGLIRAVEKLGHSIAMQSSPAAMFAIDGSFVPVTIFEKFVNNRAPADSAEMKRRHAYERKFPKFFRMMDLEGGWTHRPSGKLTIILFGREPAWLAMSLGRRRFASRGKSS